MRKKYFVIILILLCALTLYFANQYFIYYFTESLIVDVQDNNTNEIKTIKSMFNLDEATNIKKMTYIPGFPEGFNIKIIVHDEKMKDEKELCFTNALAYSEQKSFLEYYFNDEGKPPIQLYIYKTLLILSVICIILLLTLQLIKKYKNKLKR